MSFNLSIDHLTPKVIKTFESPVYRDCTQGYLHRYILVYTRFKGDKFKRTEFKFFEIFAIDQDHAIDEFHKMVEYRKWTARLVSLNQVNYMIREESI